MTRTTLNRPVHDNQINMLALDGLAPRLQHAGIATDVLTVNQTTALGELDESDSPITAATRLERLARMLGFASSDDAPIPATSPAALREAAEIQAAQQQAQAEAGSGANQEEDPMQPAPGPGRRAKKQHMSM